MDKVMTIQQAAYRYGLSQGFVRSACKRDSAHHPLPHLEHGKTRPHIYIRPEAMERWLEEEERLTVR